MKIKKFNEKISNDFVYKGTMTIEFEIDKSYVNSYAGVFSYKQVENMCSKGLLDRYIHLATNPDVSQRTGHNHFNKLDKSLEFDLYDNDGNLIGDDVYKDTKNFNL